MPYLNIKEKTNKLIENIEALFSDFEAEINDVELSKNAYFFLRDESENDTSIQHRILKIIESKKILR